ncbi:fungal-specific transcription factor domain-containing protein, partial [Talaromyces proteolyticus]
GCRQLKSNSPLTSLSIDLPLYIRPLRAAISPVDLDFLSMKGAFELPQDHLGEALLDTYLQFVHPYILVLDRANLLRVFDTRSVPSVDCDEDSKLSLLLYWAIIFAASSHIKMSILQEMGYDSRSAARRALFRKTKLLYDLHIEQDPITLLQAVLLMSYRFKETDNQRELWFIAGFSTPFLQSMDFSRLIRISAPSTKRTKLLRKIWWSCFVRDTLIAEQLMSPSKTKTEESDIPLLTLDDFDLSRDSDEALRTSAIIYIDQTKLCIHINRVLEMHASVTALISSDPAFSYGSTEAAISDLLARKIRMYDTDFTKWVNDLSEEAKLNESTAGDSSLQLQQTLLHMTYLIGLSILHRPLVLPSKSEVALARHINISIRTLSKDRLHHIATQTTVLAKTILQQQFCEYMPPYSITLLTTAITVHLMDIQFGHSAAVERLRKEVGICVRLLEDLREIYAEAD